MKKPNLRSFKGPNRAKKYAEAMEKYRKAQRAIVKSPGGKVVKSPGGKIEKAKKPGKLAKRPKAVTPTAKQLPPAGGTSGGKVIQTKSQKQAAANKRAQAAKVRREKAELKKARAAKGSGPTPGKKPIKGLPRNRTKELAKSVVNKVRKFPLKKVGKGISEVARRTGPVGKLAGRALILKEAVDSARNIKRVLGPTKDGRYIGLARATLGVKKLSSALSGKNKKTKKVAKKKVVPGTRINEFKGPKQPKITNKVVNTANKTVKKSSPVKTESKVTPAVNKTTTTVSNTTTKTEAPKKTKRQRFQEKFIKTERGTLARRGSVSARRAENKEKARNRAKAMAKKRLGKA